MARSPATCDSHLTPVPAATHRPSMVEQARASIAMRSVGRHEARVRRSVGWRNRDLVRATAIILAVFFGARLFWVANHLFFAVFLGMLFGIAVSGGVNKLQRFRIPRGIAAALIVLSCVGLMVGFGAWMAPTLREQGAELRTKLPEAADRVEEWINARRGGVLGLMFFDNGRAPAAAQPPIAGPAAQPVAPDTTQHAPGLQDQLREQMHGMSRYLFPVIASTVEIIGGLLLILFLSIYFAAEPDLYPAGLLSLLPAQKRARRTAIMDRVARVPRRWVGTQLIAMVLVRALRTTLLP